MYRDKITENIKYTEKKWTGYMQWLGKFLYTERIHYYYLYKYLKELNNLTKNTVLLDMGFGSGYNIEKISRRFHIKTIGADIVHSTVDIYNKKRIYNSYAVKIAPSDRKVPLQDNDADIIVCSHVLEHVPDDTALLKEIYRILKQTGIVYFNIPINEDKIDDPNHVRKYTPSSFKKLLQVNKFECIKEIESDIFTKWISYLGVNNSFVSGLVKRIIILILSVIPINLLEMLSGKKSQYICFARKKY